MKPAVIVKSKVVKGVERVTVELREGEQLVVVSNGYYRLGEPVDDLVMPSEALLEAERVVWCPVEQRWVS